MCSATYLSFSAKVSLHKVWTRFVRWFLFSKFSFSYAISLLTDYRSSDVTVRTVFCLDACKAPEFSPTACGDVVKKPRLDTHRGRCHSGFDCIDCHTTFSGPAEYKGHTSCITEAEKYQKSLYKGPKTVCSFNIISLVTGHSTCV